MCHRDQGAFSLHYWMKDISYNTAGTHVGSVSDSIDWMFLFPVYFLGFISQKLWTGAEEESKAYQRSITPL